MSPKKKSSLYLAAFIIAFLIYYNETNTESPQTIEMANADINQISNTDIEE